MIRKIVKYISGFIVVIIILYIIKIGLIFSNFHPYKLIDNYYLIGMGDKNYVIKKGVFGATIVDNLTYGCGWIITPSSLHGYLGEYNRYFFVEKETGKVNYYIDLSKFNDYLKTNGYKTYNLSDAEGLVHLEYGNGRNRKY